MFLLFQKYLNTQVRTKKLANSVVYHLCPSILTSGINPYFFKLLRVLSLSGMIAQFLLLWLVYSTICGKIMVFTLENEVNLWSFTHAPVLHSKLKVQFFENLFPPRAKNKGLKETMICFIKIQSENMKMIWNISLFICCMIYSFSKCDGFIVLWIISIK